LLEAEQAEEGVETEEEGVGEEAATGKEDEAALTDTTGLNCEPSLRVHTARSLLLVAHWILICEAHGM